MGGYNDACISEFLFSKVLDSVYVSHKHSVFFFFFMLPNWNTLEFTS